MTIQPRSFAPRPDRRRTRPFAAAPAAAALPALLLGAALALLAAGLLVPGCTEAPRDAGATNPFDPEGPDGGDPLHVTALLSGNSVIVQWSLVDHPGIAGYSVLHSLDGTTFDEVGAVDAQTNRFVHATPAPGVDNYYKVQATDVQNEYSSISRVVAARRWTPPALVLADSTTRTPTRHVELSVRCETGDAVDVAMADDFSDAVVLPITAGPDANLLPFDLGPATANGEKKKVWVRQHEPGLVPPVNSLQIEVAFLPTVTLHPASPTVASRDLELAIDAPGATRLRLALSEAGLATATWLEPDPLVAAPRLDAALAPQTVHAELESDFGFTIKRQVTVVPDDLTTASFELAGGEPLTDSATVALRSQAGALWMRFAQQPDLRSVPWQPYADSTTFTLTGDPGPVTVYGQFRNDWTDSPIVTDAIVLVGSDVAVSVLAPAAGSHLAGGVPLLVTGAARAGTGGAPLDSVKVDWGEGFQRVSGLTTWSILWPVPAVEAQTPVTLRARAWSGSDSITASVPVTIDP